MPLRSTVSCHGKEQKKEGKENYCFIIQVLSLVDFFLMFLIEIESVHSLLHFLPSVPPRYHPLNPSFATLCSQVN